MNIEWAIRKRHGGTSLKIEWEKSNFNRDCTSKGTKTLSGVETMMEITGESNMNGSESLALDMIRSFCLRCARCFEFATDATAFDMSGKFVESDWKSRILSENRLKTV
jgi:hypothetical protein